MSDPAAAREHASDSRRDPASLTRDARAIVDAVGSVIEGKREQIELAVVALLAEGHLLVEDVPGVGKTVLAKALARSVDGEVHRIQFTPDLLPADITGVSIFDQRSGSFVFTPGPIFANIVIGDEINRASPKTQSALLESMEERQVTVDGESRALPTPFTVVATQNPVEMQGTFALPEAQRDRFLLRISMGYPDEAAERRMLRERETGNPLDALDSVVDLARLRQMVAEVRGVHCSPAIEAYVVSLATATRADPDLRLGASPRASLQLIRAAKAHAVLAGRDFVLPDDVDSLAVPVLAHRIVLAHSSSRLGGYGDAASEIIERLVRDVEVPLESAEQV